MENNTIGENNSSVGLRLCVLLTLGHKFWRKTDNSFHCFAARMQDFLFGQGTNMGIRQTPIPRAIDK